MNTSSRKIVTALFRAAFLIILVVGFLAPSMVAADTADDIKALIKQTNEDTKKNLSVGNENVSKDGSMEFWSSGGLLQYVPPDAGDVEYVSFSLSPKHIKVITLVEGEAAVAMYYSEGSFQVKGQDPVNHYMTRISEVYVNEDGEWKSRAAHYSPIAAGSGTNQSSLD